MAIYDEMGMTKEEYCKMFRPDVDFMLIPYNRLRSDVDYQRNLRMKFVDTVCKVFDKNKMRPVRVSLRDGEYWVLDGQHTAELAHQMSKIDDIPIWCMVYRDLTYEQEAELFGRQLKWSQPLRSFDSTYALIEAKDDDAMMLKNIVNACGFMISSKTANYSISATKCLEKIVSRYDGEVLGRTLMLIADTWDGRKDFLRSSLISAIAKLVYIYNKELDDQVFVEKLGDKVMNEIILEAKMASKKTYGVDYCGGLVNLYNKKNPKKLDIKKLYE